MKIQILIGLALLAVTSAFADQASLIAELKANPTEDFSRKSFDELESLGEADGMAYFQDHPTYKIGSAINGSYSGGLARAFKHNLIGKDAFIYSMNFWTALNALAGSK